MAADRNRTGRETRVREGEEFRGEKGQSDVWFCRVRKGKRIGGCTSAYMDGKAEREREREREPRSL